ncbi:MAG: glycoside hydrolase family 15 protein, partial [Roseiflexaceae bacterium]|nr:glycoside hydrolase family 15 protein [Roseiflexaceae bacterium]
EQAAAHWHEPDAGMWEARDQARQYLSSKVLCWVALDRAVRLAPQLGEHANVTSWQPARDAIRQAILEQGWNDAVGAYTGAFGSDQLDASVLLMPLVEFLPATDQRMRATIDLIARELAADGLVHRWAGDTNGFLLCTYWLVECLARAGEWPRANDLFEQTTACANDLGLLAEMADQRGTLWGNYPQAFSHVGLINAAWTLTQTQPKKCNSNGSA